MTDHEHRTPCRLRSHGRRGNAVAGRQGPYRAHGSQDTGKRIVPGTAVPIIAPRPGSRQPRTHGAIALPAVATRRPAAARDQRRNTIPIARDRHRGFVQSGFNEVALEPRSPRPCRATSQNPPDSQPYRHMILYLEAIREADMACAYSLDLRRRVIEAIEGGLSTRAAARRFSIGISTAGAWYRRWRGTGDIRPGRQGQPPGSKLDAFEAFILGLVEERKDISLPEIAERLVEEHGVRAAPSTVWHFFDKREITYKKRRRMPRNSSARTSSSGAMPGSTARSISTPRG